MEKSHSIIVQNLKCGGCAKTIINTLTALDNVKNVEVDVNQSTVMVYATEEAVARVK